MRIALIVDHPQRDLAGALLIAFELCQRGHQCHLVPLNLQEEEVLALRPDFVLLNYARTYNEAFARKLLAVGIGFGMLDTEGGVWESLDSYTELLWRDRALLHEIGAACMWGPRLANHVVGLGLLNPARTSVTGCARFDFYHEAWRGVLLPSETRSDKHFQVLVNTNFSVVNPRFTTPEKNAAYCEREYGWSRDSITKVTNAETAAIDATIDLVHQLATERPDYSFVLRPHPFESPAPYQERLCVKPNVSVNSDGPVQPQIGTAAVVVQRSCTTAIESVAAGVPTLSPKWIPAPYLMPMAEAVSVPCESPADLLECIDGIRTQAYQPLASLQKEIDTVIGEWFYCIDGRAHNRVCDAIEAALPPSRQVNDRGCSRYLYGLHERSLTSSRYWGSRVRYALGLSPDFSFHDLRLNPYDVWSHTAKHLSLVDARSTVGRIEMAARHQGASVRPVDVATARDSGHYHHRYQGFSLSLQCQ